MKRTETGGQAAALDSETVRRINPRSLDPNPFQPRNTANPESNTELIESIRTDGILEPILARAEESGRYTIISGHRRWAAACDLKLPDIPVVVRAATDDQLETWGLVANIQREDLHPVDLLFALEKLHAKHNTYAEVGRVLGWSEAKVKLYAAALHIPRKELETLRNDPAVTMNRLRQIQSERYPVYQARKPEPSRLTATQAWNAWNNLDVPASNRLPTPDEARTAAAVSSGLSSAAFAAAETPSDARQPAILTVTPELLAKSEGAPLEPKTNILEMPERIRHKDFKIDFDDNRQVIVRFHDERKASAAGAVEALKYALKVLSEEARKEAGEGVRVPAQPAGERLKRYRRKVIA